MELTMVPFHEQSSEEKPDPASARYRECLRNHAAALGGLANDGCGEFMEAPSSPLLCAACGCHRNFHRKELPALVPYSGGVMQRQQYYMGSRFVHGAQRHAMMLCGPAQMVEPVQAVMAAPAAPEEAEASATRKRYRTKFTAEQKEKMANYAERRGWRVGGKGEDEEELRRFCDEVGVTPHVLRVWVHNHRHAAARVAAAAAAAGDDGGCRVATDAAADAAAAAIV